MGAALTTLASGTFWNRLGLLEATALDMQSVLGGTATTNAPSGVQLSTRLSAWLTSFITNGVVDATTVGFLQQTVAAMQQTPLTIVGVIGQLVPSMLVTAALADTPGVTPTPAAALQLLVEEMVAAAAYINRGTVPSMGAQTAVAWVTPTGNPTFAWSVVDSAGRALQYTYPGEVFSVSIVQDAQNGATAGQEPYTIMGMAQNPAGSLAWDWLVSGKYGSGASLSGTLVDPFIDCTSATQTTGNLTTNGTFTQWAATNQAANWVYVTGVATTNFINSTATTTYYSNGGSLELLSAGGVKCDMRMSFNTAASMSAGLGGTPYAFEPSAVNNAQWILFIPIKLKTASPTNGTLTIDIIDATPTTIVDDFGTANSLAVDLTAIADTNWRVKTLAVRMPLLLSTVTPFKLRIAFTGTILDVTNAVYIGAVGMALATQAYPGGPYVAAFRGSTNPQASGSYPDAWTFTLSYTPGKYQKAIFRYFNPPALGPQTPGLIVPAITSGSATIADSGVA